MKSEKVSSSAFERSFLAPQLLHLQERVRGRPRDHDKAAQGGHGGEEAYVSDRNQVFGTIEGNFENDLLGYVYYSAVCYTTLGFGDLIPVGHIRCLTAMTALSGLVFRAAVDT